jgi:uncharacterized protein YcnI
MKIHRNITALLVVGAVTLATAPTAFGHATISAIQPQGDLKTAKRTSYVVRSPNEKDTQNVRRVDLFVPAQLQEAISVKKVAGWKIKLKKKDTGKVSSEGSKIMAITQVTWYASKDAEIEPHMYEEFPVRFQNPATPMRLCFPIVELYGPKTKGGDVERVFWTGATGSEKPASCLDFVA